MADWVPAAQANVRAADSDREMIAERLRDAAGEGRLTLEELQARLDQTYQSRTYGELAAVVADLPPDRGSGQVVPAAPGSPAPLGGDGVLRLSAGGGNRSKTGAWDVPERIVANAGMGDVKLDFTEAVCRHRVVHVEARAWAGNVVLVVPAGWSVNLDAVSASLGSVKDKVRAAPVAGGPTVIVTGHAAMGTVIARHPRSSRFLPR
jgi:hypothetical protein